jgi:hypothetical protein
LINARVRPRCWGTLANKALDCISTPKVFELPTAKVTLPRRLTDGRQHS